MNLPSHPQSDDHEPANTGNRAATILVAVVVALVVVVVVLHLTGVVGPAGS